MSQLALSCTAYLLVAVSLPLTVVGQSSGWDSQWNRLPGPPGGPVWALAKADDGTVLAGASSYLFLVGGVFVSRGDVVRWHETALTGLVETEVLSLEVVDQDHWVAGVHFLNALIRGTAFVTLDGGSTWKQSNLTDAPLVLEPFGDSLFAGTVSGLYISGDGGESWAPSSLAADSVHAVESCRDALLAAASDSLFVLDSSREWQPLDIPIQNLTVIGASHDCQWYVGSREGVWYTADRGESWNSVLDSLDITSIHLDGGNVIVGTRSGGLIKRDGQSSWMRFDVAGGVSAAAVLGAGILTAGPIGVSYISANHTVDHVGVPNETISALAVSKSGLLAASRGGVRVSYDRGDAWQTDGLAGQFISDVATGGENRYATTTNFGGFYHADEDSDWHRIGPDVQPSFVATSGSGEEAILGGPGPGGVYTYSAMTDSWSRLDHPLISSTLVMSAATDGTRMAVGTQSGLLTSVDGGESWQQELLPAGASAIEHIALSPNSYYSASSSTIYRENPDGSWKTVLTMESDLVTDLHVNSSIVAVGTQRNGVYYSVIGSEAWHNIREGLTSGGPAPVALTSVVAVGDTLVVGTASHGLFRTTINVLPNSKESPSRLDISSLHCYPRPTFSTAWCELAGYRGELVHVKLYDTLGRLVQQVVESKTLDSNRFVFPLAAPRAPGVYFLVAEGSEFRVQESIVVTSH